MSAVPLSIWRGDTLTTRPPRSTSNGTVRVGREALSFAIADALTRHPGVTEADVMGKSRVRPIAHARQEVMWLLSEARWADGGRRYSLPAIATALGMGDHTSILHGVRVHAKRMASQ